MARRLFFNAAYWFGFAPWNTGVTPPEVYQFLEEHSTGRALDLGCGTGTNALTLAEHGWQVEGVDYIPRAIRIACRKAEKRGLAEKAAFRVGSVLDPAMYQGEYDLILDIGCFHGLGEEDAVRYQDLVSASLAPQGTLLLYAHLKAGVDEEHGASESSLARMGELLKLIKRVDGTESSRPSAWLEFRKI